VLLADVVTYPEQFATTEQKLVICAGDEWQHGQEVSLRSLAYLFLRHESLRHLQLRGPAYIQIVRLAGEAQLRLARQAVLDELAQRLPWRDWQIDVQFSAADELALAHAGSFSQIRHVTTEPGQLLGQVTMTLVGRDQAEHDMTVRISPRVLRQVTRVALTGRQPAGHVLTADEVIAQTLWVDDDRQEFVERPEECTGFELDRLVNAGDLLRLASLRKPTCAVRGDEVWVTCCKGPLSVRLVALAEESGRLGDEVRVRNRLSGKVFRAILTAHRTALLQIGEAPTTP